MRLLSATTALFLLAAKMALAQPQELAMVDGSAAEHTQQGSPPATQAAVRAIDPAAIVVPAEAGHVVSTHLLRPSAATAPTTLKTILHIQDAHTNYEAQKHLAQIVDALAKTYGVQLVLVEGGVDDVGFSYLRPRAPLDKRQAGAEKLLKEGEISGEEYLDIIADYPLTLWGIESDKLYNANLKAFLDTETVREQAKPLVDRLRAALTSAGKRLYSADLRALQRAAADYEAGQLSFSEYLALMKRDLEHAGLTLDAYPALNAFVEAQRLESSIDMPKVQSEQTQALQMLQQRLPGEQFSALMEAGRQMQAGAASALMFYTQLNRGLRDTVTPETSYPHLRTYIQHLTMSQRIETAQLAKELEQCAIQLQRLLAGSDHVRALLTLEQEVAVVGRLVTLELTPEEYLTFAARLEQTPLRERWEPQLRALTVGEELIAQLPRLETVVSQVAQFYTVARQRNHVMVDKALKKMDEMHATNAILIAGGFHTPNLVKMLNAHGVQVVVIAPKVTQATDEALYHYMLKYKSGIPTQSQQELQ